MQRRDLTFRVFVSSTFSDLVAERHALQKTAFSNLRVYCEERGARFQAIDLRWGVSEEAGLDQQTMEICLQELKRCQTISPRPNFIVLLGDRYGWRPLPSRVEAGEFELLLWRVPEDQWTPLLEWYQRDENAIPPEYCLQPRRVETREDQSEAEKQVATEEEARQWHGKVEPDLRSLLLGAVREAFSNPDDPRRQKYEDSATHHEIRHGALRAEDAEEHVFAYFRSIKGLPEDESAKDYRDLQDGVIDVEARERLESLKEEELRSRLPTSHVFDYTADWRDDQPQLDLGVLCARVEADLKAVIDAELAAFKQVSELEREIEAHREFGRQRSEHFVGRQDILKRLQAYIQGENNQPFVVSGVSGSGKTALMSGASRWSEENDATTQAVSVVCRYCGATPGSSDVRSLLESVCRQIGQVYGHDLPVPEELSALIEEFPRRLSLASSERPLRVFLDALDQLSPTDRGSSLGWLPRQLSNHAKLIVSVVESEGSEGNCDRLVRRMFPAENQVRLGPLSATHAEALLDAWLLVSQRQLQSEQRREVLGKFALSGLPLYLRLAFGESRRWKSYDSPRSLPADVPGLITAMLLRLEEERNHGRILTSRALGYLAAGRHGLTEEELLDLLSADELVQADFRRRSPRSPITDRLPVVIWSRLFSDLELFLSTRRADDTQVLGFYHRQLQQVSSDRYVHKGDRAGFHRLVANYFESLPTRFQGGRPNLRKFSELPWQLSQDCDWDRLRFFLLDIRNLMTLRRVYPWELHVYWSRIKHKYDPAREYEQAVGEYAKEVSPPELADALTSLGHFYGSWGSIQELTTMHKRALELRESEFGPEHELTLDSVTFLACAMESSNNLSNARELHQRAFDGRTRLFGPEHPSTLKALNNLASVTAKSRDAKTAATLFRQIYDASAKNAGQSNYVTLISASNLANCLVDLQKFAEAEQFLRIAAEGLQRTFGWDNPETQNVSLALASLLCFHSTLDEAIDLMQRIIDSSERTLGKDDPRTIGILNKLALAFTLKGDAFGARNVCRDSWKRCKRGLDPSRPGTIQAMIELGYLLVKCGDLSTAIGLCESAMFACRTTCISSQEQILTFAINLGSALGTSGVLGEAERVYADALHHYDHYGAQGLDPSIQADLYRGLFAVYRSAPILLFIAIIRPLLRFLKRLIRFEFRRNPKEDVSVDRPAAAASAEVAVPMTKFNVVLEVVGDNERDVIKIVRAATGLGVTEVRDLVEATPIEIMTGISEEDAENLKKELEDIGATVKIECPAAGPRRFY